MSLRNRHVVLAPFAIASLLMAQASYAQPAAPSANDQAAAQALFDNARKAMDSGDFAHACPMFESSQKLDPQPGTQFNLAACYDKGGKAASAWITYQEAASASAAAGRPEWAEKAKEKAATIEPRVAKIAILPVTQYAGFEVRRDGVVVEAGAFNVALPIDGGDHVIEATAPHKNKWRTKLKVVDGQTAKVKIPALTDEADTSAVQTEVDDSVPPPLPPDTTPVSDDKLPRILAYTSFGLAGATAIVGGVFGVLAMSKKSDADPLCSTATMCSSAGASLISSAQTFATLSTIFFVAAGVSVLEGITLLLTAPRAAAPAPTQSVRLELGAPRADAGVSLRGAW